MRALVIGGDSNLGRALCGALLARGHEVRRTTRRRWGEDPSWVHCDLRFPSDFEHLWTDAGPEKQVIYIMAAITGIMRAETDPDAWEVNAEAPLLIAQQARAAGHHVVFISSGTVERAQHTALARQKAYADQAVLMLGGCVVRPLPHVAPSEYDEVAAVLVHVGEQRTKGVVRWRGG